jgi:hypothetical protein
MMEIIGTELSPIDSISKNNWRLKIDQRSGFLKTWYIIIK